MGVIYQWIDLIWLPVVLVAIHKQHRWLALGFLAACMLMMRLQVELMVGTGYAHGFIPWWDSHVHTRALVVYSLIYIGYFILAYYSPGTRPVVFMAASIAIFFFALVLSMGVMVL